MSKSALISKKVNFQKVDKGHGIKFVFDKLIENSKMILYIAKSVQLFMIAITIIEN